MKTAPIIFTIAGAILTFIANYFFIEQLTIPDPCKYHSAETSVFFDLFYDLPSVDGGHPFPTIFNLLLTITLGGLIGFYITKWRPKKTAHNKSIAAVGHDVVT